MNNSSDRDSLLFYAGTYVSDDSPSIFLLRLDTRKGAMECIDQFPAGRKPTFLAIHPNRKFLYSVNEMTSAPDQPEGLITAWNMDPANGALTRLNQSTCGATLCHVSTDRTGRYALAASYSRGILYAYPIGKDGQVGPASDSVQHSGSGRDPKRQAGPHAHSIRMDPDNRFALACDLGLDKVFIYRLDPDHGKLLPHGEARLHPGAGPRHLDFHPNGNQVYVINELDSTMTVFNYDAEGGTLTTIQTIGTLPAGCTQDNACAEVSVHPSGRYVYGSNRFHDSMVIYGVEPKTGRLTLIGHEPTQGKTPRHFTLDPSGQFLLAANLESNSVVLFRLDSQTGKLTGLHQIEIPKPVCVIFGPR